MSHDNSPEAVARRRLQAEIDRIVAEAAINGCSLLTAKHATRLFAAYPGAHWSIRRITDELIATAAVAKVPVEISRE